MLTTVPSRSCGSCTACCDVFAIEVLSKPAGVPCQHSTGGGCAIYSVRPQACARWFCLWRKIAALPERLRPDRSGVLFSLNNHSPTDESEGVCIVGRVMRTPRKTSRRDISAAFAMFARDEALPVWRVDERGATMVGIGPTQPD